MHELCDHNIIVTRINPILQVPPMLLLSLSHIENCFSRTCSYSITFTCKMPSCDSEVCDIEDAIGKDDLTPNDRITPRGAVLPKARVRSTRNGVNETPVGDSIIPGTQKIYVRTWGCSHNNSDGEYMAGQLAAFGYKITGTVHCSKKQNYFKSIKSKAYMYMLRQEHVNSDHEAMYGPNCN